MKQFFYLFLAISCTSPGEQTAIELPFYNEPTFTPEWIDASDPSYDSIHTIAPFSFQDQMGKVVSQESTDGKVYVANFFFSICPNVCPKMTNNLHKVQVEFANNTDVTILSHTVMPWVDSVARLNEYARLNEINNDKWHLLTGDQKVIYELARSSYFADEGFGKTITEDEDFLHTEKLILIDQKRRIRGVYNGTLPLETSRMIEDIYSLIK